MSHGTHSVRPRFLRTANGLLLICAVVFNSTAFAQSGSAAATGAIQSDSRERASALMRQGLEEFRKKNIEGAREAFAQAWAIEKHSAIAANLADMELRLGRYRDGAEHWSYYLRNAPPERDRLDAQNAIAECRKHVASLAISATSGTEIAVNGRVVGSTPIDSELWLEPGTYSVAARFQDGRAVTQEVVLVAGDVRQLVLVAPEMAAPSSRPLSGEGLPAVDVKPQATSSTSLRAPVLVAGTVFTAIATGAGIIFALKSQRESDAADSQKSKINIETTEAHHEQFVVAGRACTPPYGMPAAGCDALAASVDSARRARTSAQIAFISAGVLGVGTLAVLLLWPKSNARENHALTISPWSETRGAGLSAYGSF